MRIELKIWRLDFRLNLLERNYERAAFIYFMVMFSSIFWVEVYRTQFDSHIKFTIKFLWFYIRNNIKLKSKHISGNLVQVFPVVEWGW